TGSVDRSSSQSSLLWSSLPGSRGTRYTRATQAFVTLTPASTTSITATATSSSVPMACGAIQAASQEHAPITAAKSRRDLLTVDAPEEDLLGRTAQPSGWAVLSTPSFYTRSGPADVNTPGFSPLGLSCALGAGCRRICRNGLVRRSTRKDEGGV